MVLVQNAFLLQPSNEKRKSKTRVSISTYILPYLHASENLPRGPILHFLHVMWLEEVMTTIIGIVE